MAILPPDTPVATPARQLAPPVRQQLALAALTGTPLAHLADRHHVSRKFVRRQRHRAQQALDQAFRPAPPPEQRVLFHLPVTKAWLEQLTLALLLIGHCSLRGAHEILRDLFDHHQSLGSLQALACRAADQAAALSAGQDLTRVRVAALDEIFQNHQPVLAVVDTASTYCCSLRLAEHRDADTWGVHLLELQQHGCAPVAAIADGATGLRSGVKQAWPGVPCHADVWHSLPELGTTTRFLVNRAYATITADDRLSRQLARHPQDARLRQRWEAARRERDQAITLADDVTLLLDWLQRDVLALTGPEHQHRRVLFDFVLGELSQRQALCPHRLGAVCRLLAGQQEELLGFVVGLDTDVADLAAYAQVSPAVVRELVAVQELPQASPRKWQRDAALRQALGGRYHALSELVASLRAGVVRASSVVENVNSRLRNYFFLRKEIGGGYLELLRFFLNHRRFLRSEHAARVGKSPAELLTGQSHPHWLQLLGYERFRRAA
jgi:hypothetical protein